MFRKDFSFRELLRFRVFCGGSSRKEEGNISMINSKLIKGPQTKDFNLKFFKKEKFLLKDELERIFRRSPELMAYLPDSVKFKTVSKSLLFSILKEVKPETYHEMELAVNKLRNKRKEKRLTEFKVNIKQDILRNLRKEAKVVVSAKERKSTFVKSKKKKKSINGVQKNDEKKLKEEKKESKSDKKDSKYL